MKMRNQASLQTHGLAARATCAGLLVLAAAVALAGCANFQAWGQKTSGSPATMGGAFNIPFGK